MLGASALARRFPAAAAAGARMPSARRAFASGTRGTTRPRRNAALAVGVAAGTVGAAAAAAALVVVQEPTSLDKLGRPFAFWREMFPIYLKYRYTQWRLQAVDEAEERDRAWDALHRAHAPQVLDLFLRLRGLYIKLGQMLATRQDIAPQVYREHFAELLDNVPALSGAEARDIIERSLGRPLGDVFADFDDEALGAASIGQVHRATLHDGRAVVVKIQYPDAHELVRQDLVTSKQFAQLAQPEQVPAMDELKRQVLEEFHFDKEAWALETIGKSIAPYFSDVIIPQPVHELSNKTVLVMEYIPGVKFTDAILADAGRIAARMGATIDDLRAGRVTTWMGIRYGAHAAADAAYTALAASYNWTLGWVAPNLPYPRKPLDIKHIFHQLVQVHGREILIDGLFNGDPHPGNILYTPSGKIGLIDYGQVKALTRRERRELAQLILLLAQGESAKEATIEQIKKMGFVTTKGDPHVLYKTCVIAFDRDDPEVCEGMNLQQYLEYLSKRDQTKRLPEQYIMAVRACILLRGMAALIGGGNISIAREWVPLAKQALAMFPEDPATDDEKPEFVPRGA